MHALATVFVAVLVVLPAASGAAPKDCDNPPAPGSIFEKLECRQENLDSSMSDILGKFVEGTHLRSKLDELDPGQGLYKQLENAKARTAWGRDHHDAKFFERHAMAVARGNKNIGHLIPLTEDDDDYPGFADDGICDWEQGDGSAVCAAIEVDEEGNPLPCNPEKKNRGKNDEGDPPPGNNAKFQGLECDRYVDMEAPAGPLETADYNSAAELLDGEYAVWEGNLANMNQQLQVVEDLAQARRVVILDNGNGCVISRPDPDLSTAVDALQLTQVLAIDAARIADSASGQTAFGFNARGAAVAADIIAGAAELAYIVSSQVLEDQAGQMQEEIANCINGVSEQIAALTSAVAAMHVQMAAEHEYMTELLYTAQGLRGGFPNK